MGEKDQPDDTPSPTFSEGQLERARKRIQKKLDHEDTEQVYKNYMEVMFRNFLSRIDRAVQEGELVRPKSLPRVEDLPPLEKTKVIKQRRKSRQPPT